MRSGVRVGDWRFLLVGVGLLLLSSGCGVEPQTFEINRLAAEVLAQENGVPMDEAASDVRQILDEMFGTLNEPRIPDVAGIAAGEVVDVERLKRAAGPVYSDQANIHFGLFREHCVNCHGLSGTGRGPAAALQNPYPRDYTAGVFKYKSTERGKKPTRENLMRTIVEGLPGTSMPAFGLVDEEDLEALVDYVIYLSMRGEVERRLLAIAARDLDYESADGERWIRPERWEGAEGDLAKRVAMQREWIDEEVESVMAAWSGAEQFVSELSPSEFSGDRSERIAAGREIFHGQIANCASCHGKDGAGLETLPPDYDEWTKDWTIRMGVDPKDREKLAAFFAAGALKPKQILPRNLQHGVFRGGREPEDIYRRIVHGIEGTPMPAVSRVDVGDGSVPSGAGLTDQQVWQLVEYVLSLGTAGEIASKNVAEAAEFFERDSVGAGAGVGL